VQGSNFIADKIRKYRIIDSHGHMGYYKLFNMPGNSADKMVETMDRVGIEKICVSAMPGLEVDYRYGNEMVADAIRRFGSRFLGYACINPYEQDDIIPELERCFDKLGMCAIKLHPDLIDCPAESSRYNPVYEFANERKLVIMNHTWGRPKFLADLAEKYKDVKFVHAHYGSVWDGVSEFEMLKLFRDIENVYVDNAGSSGYLGAFERLVDYVGADKIVFGTDMPFLDARHQIGNVVLSEIDEEAKIKILSKNFLSLIGLEG
jgi:predicted TIM-barrel fold metal-dependent hydrolase